MCLCPCVNCAQIMGKHYLPLPGNLYNLSLEQSALYVREITGKSVNRFYATLPYYNRILLPYVCKGGGRIESLYQF